MTFSLQHRNLSAALEGAGLCPKAAGQIASVLCNGAQELRHNGPMIHDSTPPQMRRVTPDIRKHVLPNFDFEQGDPDFERPKIEPSEDTPPLEPQPTVVTTVSPQQSDGVFRVKGGSLSDSVAVNNGARVDVRSRIARKPPGGLPVAMIDEQANELVGKRLRAEVTRGQDRLRAEIKENNEDVAVSLRLEDLREYDVITGMEYVPGTGIRLSYDTVTAFSGTASKESWIYTQDETVVTGIADDLRGFRAHARRIPVFESNALRNEYLYFNTFRIGTFTGGWTPGQTKTVSQVWPSGGRDLEVKNLTTAVPNTPEQKYVLFAPRTEDQVNVQEGSTVDINGEDEGPYVNSFPPVIEYIALEIQQGPPPPEGCTAFTYLDGFTVSSLPGYIAGECQAITHNPYTDCLEWGSQKLNVITSVIYSPSAITFMQQEVTVLCAGLPTEALTIPLTACPDPDPDPDPGCPSSCSYYWNSGTSEWVYNGECEVSGCVCASSPSGPPTGGEELYTDVCISSVP